MIQGIVTGFAGQDATLRTVKTKDGGSVAVASIQIGEHYGRGDETRWIELSIWGERAARIAEHVKSGMFIVAEYDDIESSSWMSGGEIRSKTSLRTKRIEWYERDHSVETVPSDETT